jgi:hypothetical protein
MYFITYFHIKLTKITSNYAFRSCPVLFHMVESLEARNFVQFFFSSR